MTDTVVEIIRSGNLLKVTPPCQHILDSILGYKHRRTKFGRAAIGAKHEITIEDASLYRVKDGSLYTLHGARHRIETAFAAHGIQYTYTDLRVNQTLEPNYEHLQQCMPRLNFRLKQDEIMARIIALDSGQIEAPTAYGKTFIMLVLVALYPEANIIIASPSTALLKSTYRRLLEITPYVGRVGGGQSKPDRVTLATFKSIMHAPIDICDILLIDECHRLAADQISKNVAKITSPVKTFGMTATPVGRSDGAEAITEFLVGPVIYRIEYEEAEKAGLVAKMKVVLLNMDTCPAGTKTDTLKTRPAKKRRAYWRNNVRNSLFANRIQHIPAALEIVDPQILVLVETTEHAFRMQLLLPDFEVIYGSMDKKRLAKFVEMGLVSADYKPLTGKQRDIKLTRFETGGLRKVIATGCWGEGVDFIYLDVVVNMSGMVSPIDTVQWAGRNSRINESKKFGLIIDSKDKWDRWASRRAGDRMRIYKKKGWELLKDPLDTEYSNRG